LIEKGIEKREEGAFLGEMGKPGKAKLRIKGIERNKEMAGEMAIARHKK